MPLVLIVETNGTIKELAMKQYTEEDLYKRAGFKTSDGFKLHCIFSVPNSTMIVRLYGKSVGKANRENKYEFPPPVDQTLFFGSCLLMAMDATTTKGRSESEREDSKAIAPTRNGGGYPSSYSLERPQGTVGAPGCFVTEATRRNMEPIDFPKSAWETLYVQLHGGFDDLDEVGGDAADEAADAAEAAADAANTLELGMTLTKEGYAKDGFIVDDDNDDDTDAVDDVADDTDAEEYFAPTPAKRNRRNIAKPDMDEPQMVKSKPKRVSKPKGTAAATGKDRPVPVMMFTDQDNLKEEPYIVDESSHREV